MGWMIGRIHRHTEYHEEDGGGLVLSVDVPRFGGQTDMSSNPAVAISRLINFIQLRYLFEP